MAGQLTVADKGRIIDLYETRLARLGRDVRTVGWGSRADQWLRFDMLARDLELDKRRILDVGCGLGDFVSYLDERGCSGYDYLGIDLASKLVDEARRFYDRPNCRFEVADLLDGKIAGDFDVIVSSGALSFKVEDNLALAKQMIATMAAMAREAVSVNFLSTRVDYMLEKNFHYAPDAMLAFALSLSPRVRLYHDYPLYEFTLQILTDDRPQAKSGL